MTCDRFGIGWRDELAAGILTHLDRIDVVEVILESALDAPRKRIAALRTLGAQVPIVLHGVSLGLASVNAVSQARLDAVARVVGQLQPLAWSEHLAFVRAGGIELGHLAMPPRTCGTVEGALRNLARARVAVGSMPWLENVATLMEPPCSTLDEPSFVAEITRGAGCPVLLDLQNLYTNACNLGHDPVEMLLAMPLERVAMVHIAGGKPIRASDGGTRLLDDHLHDVSEPVYALLRELGRHAPQPLTVLLERDGAFPRFESLLEQVERARTELAWGRAQRKEVA
jgi:uncharacterized protein (UPF0276 family)